jgi:hypothetical protein
MISKEKFILDNRTGGLGYGYSKGSFFIIDKKNKTILHDTWPRTCRVEFASDFQRGKNWIGFQILNLKIDLLNEFFQNIEKKLNIKNPTVFYYSNENVVVINVSSFWMKTALKRSVFTLFLRCGAMYYNGNFLNAINSYDLTYKVKSALERFLDGHTFTRLRKIDNDGYPAGFVTLFEYMSEKQLVRHLIKK